MAICVPGATAGRTKVGRVDRRIVGNARRGVRRIAIDPRARHRVGGQRRGLGNANVTGARAQRDVAHRRATSGDIGLGFAERARDRVPRNQEAGELVDGIGNPAQSGDHVPLPEQDPRQLARGNGRGIAHRKSLGRPSLTCQRIADRRARFRSAQHRVPYGNGVVECAVQLIQDPDGHHSALAVADQHRHHPVGFVVPRQRARPRQAVAETSLGQTAIQRIANPRRGITHRDQEFRKRLHRHRCETPLQQDDSRRGSARQPTIDVRSDEVPAIERNNVPCGLFIRNVRRALRRIGGICDVPRGTLGRCTCQCRAQQRAADDANVSHVKAPQAIIAADLRPDSDVDQDWRGKNLPVRCMYRA